MNISQKLAFFPLTLCVLIAASVQAQTKPAKINQNKVASEPVFNIQTDESAYREIPFSTPVNVTYKSILDNHYQGGDMLGSNDCKPEYPLASARNEETGNTRILMQISENGLLTNIKVLKSSGFKRLDNAIVERMLHCSFRPISVNNVPVRIKTYMEYAWRLD